MKSGLEIKLEEEIARNRGLLKVYQNFPQGAFAHMVIEQDIEYAEHAIKTLDAVDMVKALGRMEGNE